MRLQKYLAHAGVCSRRKAEQHILDGKVKINQTIVTKLGTMVDIDNDQVFFENKQIELKEDQKKIYILMNKPPGYVTSCSQKNTKIILELVDINQRIFPIGRLDKDSQGLVLLTNDGELHNKLSHPSFDHEKEYIVSTQQAISEYSLKQMAEGMMIDNVKTRKAKVKRLAKNRFVIVLKQGLNRQIRKMVGKTGNTVDTLQRVRMANIRLGRLKLGQWRYLTPKEIKVLTQ